MFDHVVFGVSDYEASKTFFLKALEPLGVAVVSEGPLGVELCRPDNNTSFQRTLTRGGFGPLNSGS